MAKINKQELLIELEESRKSLRTLYYDAESLSSNVNDELENIARIINMIEDDNLDEEDELDNINP